MLKSLKLLQIEDSERDASLIQRHLSRGGFDLVSRRVETPEAMRAALEAEPWDVILCDYSMPHFSALKALELTKAMGLDLPFIIISGTIGEEAAVQAMHAGAHDYLMKDNLVRLAAAIKRELHEAKSRRARREAEQNLAQAEEKYRGIFENAVEGIYQSTPEGKFIAGNPALARLLGYGSAAELFADRTDLEHQHYVDPKDYAEFKRLIEEEGQVFGFEARVSCQDGSVIWVSENARAVRGEDGALLYYEGFVKNITERKKAEKAIKMVRTLILVGFSTLAIMVALEVLENFARFVLTDYAALGLHIMLGSITVIAITYLALRKQQSLFRRTLEEVTERKQAEQEQRRLSAELAGERERLKKLIANVPGVVYEIWGEPDAARQRADFVSDYAEIMLGYTAEEWLAKPNFWLEIVHPDDRERAGRDAAADYAAGKTAKREFRWMAKDGSVLWVESTYDVIKDDDGRSIGLRGVTVDVTERKRAEQKLRKSQERYRDLVENALDIIYTQDLKGNYTSVNEAVEQIGGYTREESLRMNLADTVAPEYLEKAREMLARKLAGETVTAYELEILAKDGRRVSVEVNTRIIYEDGVAVGVQGIARDVTERKQLEDQLRQSQKMEAVGQLAGGIAHDFNNLLTVISGYSELALRSLQAEDPLRHKIEEIRKAGNSAAALTRQLLAFSRKQVLQPKVLGLNTVVNELEKMLRRLIGEDVELRTVLADGLGNVKADPGQVEQVIMNLAINARDAMPHGGKLTIETQNIDFSPAYARQYLAVEPGRYVMLAVSDTGEGMDEATQARIYEPFFTTKEAGKGTGLGLSTVYGIVKQSEGNILVYSEVGRGTSFKVYLPRVDEEAQKPTRAAGVVETLRGNETILLIEDDERLRVLAREVLRLYGYRVLEASNGGSALLICERHPEPIHLLLTDVIMPEMGGPEAAARLARVRPAMKVLYMSGYTDNAVVHQGVLNQGANFIQKPFSPEELVRKIRNIIDN